MLNCVIVGIGGFIGTVCRYLIGLLPFEMESGFPVKTLAINVIGAFLISLIAAIAAENKSFPPQVALMLRVGICGGFTTFSTYLMKNGQTVAAFAYICISVVLGVAAVFAAQMLVR